MDEIAYVSCDYDANGDPEFLALGSGIAHSDVTNLSGPAGGKTSTFQVLAPSAIARVIEADDTYYVWGGAFIEFPNSDNDDQWQNALKRWYDNGEI